MIVQGALIIFILIAWVNVKTCQQPVKLLLKTESVPNVIQDFILMEEENVKHFQKIVKQLISQEHVLVVIKIITSKMEIVKLSQLIVKLTVLKTMNVLSVMINSTQILKEIVRHFQQIVQQLISLEGVLVVKAMITI